MIKSIIKVSARAAWDFAVFAVADTRELWQVVGEIFDEKKRHEAAATLGEDLHRPRYPMPDTTPPVAVTVPTDSLTQMGIAPASPLRCILCPSPTECRRRGGVCATRHAA